MVEVEVRGRVLRSVGRSGGEVVLIFYLRSLVVKGRRDGMWGG